jgi:hypothetical protein
MEAAAVSHLKPAASELLLEHCHALDIDSRGRPTAADRLEALIGKELARRLVRALSSSWAQSGSGSAEANPDPRQNP